MIMKFQTLYNRDQFLDNRLEEPQGISMTVPNDALSVQEILDRYSRGLPVGGRRVPIYNDDINVPDFERMDLADREAFARENAANLQRLKDELNQKARDQKASDDKKGDSDVKE